MVVGGVITRKKFIRPVVVDNVIKMLSCGDHIRGFASWVLRHDNEMIII